MYRELDAIEEHNINHFVGMHVVKYSGHVNELALRQAFDALCIKYPILRGHVARKKNAYVFRVTETNTAEFSIIHDGLDGLLSQLEISDSAESATSSIELPIPKLARLILAPCDEGGYVMMAIHHILTGGGTSGYYLGELWSLYTDILKRPGMPLVSPGELPSPPTELLKERWRVVDETFKENGSSPLSIDRTIETTSRKIKFDRKQTAQLVSKARSLHITVNSLLIGKCASILQSFEPNASGLITVACQVRFFERMSPPISMAETTNCLGWVFTPLRADNGNPIEIGREFKKLTNEVLNTRSVHIENYTDSAENIERRIVNSDIYWNAGANRVPPFTVPNNLKIEDIFELHYKADEIGRNRRAIPKRWKIMAFCMTVNEELSLMLTTATHRSQVIENIQDSIYSVIE